jgi:hypothetical protein
VQLDDPEIQIQAGQQMIEKVDEKYKTDDLVLN